MTVSQSLEGRHNYIAVVCVINEELIHLTPPWGQRGWARRAVFGERGLFPERSPGTSGGLSGAHPLGVAPPLLPGIAGGGGEDHSALQAAGPPRTSARSIAGSPGPSAHPSRRPRCRTREVKRGSPRGPRAAHDHLTVICV